MHPICTAANGGKSMIDTLKAFGKTEHVLFKCIYCNKYRNATGYWIKNQAADFLRLKEASHGICPICFQKYFPEEYASLCRNGVVTIQKTFSTGNMVTYEIFCRTERGKSKGLFGKFTTVRRE